MPRKLLQLGTQFCEFQTPALQLDKGLHTCEPDSRIRSALHHQFITPTRLKIGEAGTLRQGDCESVYIVQAYSGTFGFRKLGKSKLFLGSEVWGDGISHFGQGGTHPLAGSSDTFLLGSLPP